MKKLLFLVLLPLMVTISGKCFSQTWDQKTIEHRRTEILYKLCNGCEINQKDYSDLFEKGLLDLLIKNIKDHKDVEQITKIIDSSNKFFYSKCLSYKAKTDSLYNVYLSNIKADSIAIPEKK